MGINWINHLGVGSFCGHKHAAYSHEWEAELCKHSCLSDCPCHSQIIFLRVLPG